MKTNFTILLLLCLTYFGYAQNTGLAFNGLDTRVEIADKPELNVSDPYTLEAWIYANQWAGQSWQGSLITSDNQGPDRGFAFRCGGNGTLSFVMAADNAWNEVQSSPVMNVEQWHHVAVVVDAGTMTLYIDGEVNGSASYSGTISPNENPITIGASTGFDGRHFDGSIDEVRFWNTARSQQQIADNQSVDLTGNEANLVGYFPFNDGSGTTATNLVDAACSGTLLNMDDNNWVDGYAIAQFDVNLSPLKGVDLINMKDKPVKLEIDIKNLGQQAISDVFATVAVNGNDQFTETINASIGSGELFTYEFQSPVDLTGLTDPELSVVINHADDQNLLNNSKSIIISTPSNPNVVRLFNGKTHNFGAAGQTQNNCVILPGSLSQYEQLLMHISVDCPGSGCDPWDQPAKVSIETDQGTFEIARYVTPYAIACGPWTVDVTDFKDVMTGPVNFVSYVQVWGSSGWLVTIDLELIEGTAEFPYYQISPLWETDYHVYGDPGIDDDLAPVSLNVDSNTESSHIRMTISGHGQGNTDNAAEFSEKTHNFTVNGSVVDNHLLWKDDCASNPCEDQQGTWLFPRAGWCPGQQVSPYTVSTTGTLSAGSSAEFDYVLEDYTNLLNTGYNGSSHTEPHYRIWSYFVEQSAQPFKAYNNLTCDAITPTVTGSEGNESLDAVSITITNSGTEDMTNFDVSYFINSNHVATENISQTLSAGQSIVHDFTTVEGLQLGETNTFYGVVSSANDETPGDDAAKAIAEILVSTQDLNFDQKFEVFPNPSNTGMVAVEIDASLIGSQLEILTVDGKLISNFTAVENINQFNIEHPGIYMIKITNAEGKTNTKKLVVLN